MTSSKIRDDRPFNVFRCASSEKTKKIVRDVITLIEENESRPRKRRKVDQKNFEHAIDALVSDLMYQHLRNPSQKLYTSRSKGVLEQKSRYRPSHFGGKHPEHLDILSSSELGILEQDVGGRKSYSAYFPDEGTSEVPLNGYSTTIVAGERLKAMITEHGLTPNDFTINPPQELIILKNKKADSPRSPSTPTEYEDTESTHLYRRQMEDINQWINTTDIDVDGWGIESDIDVSMRSLRRSFTYNSFSSGGRLVGGFWMSMSKKQRTERLLINSEKVTTLDYSQLTPRILYGMTDTEPPKDDAYTIPGYEDYREGIKKVFAALTFDMKPRTKLPKGIPKLLPTFKATGDDRNIAEQIIRLLKEKHPAIADMFSTGIGHKVQFIESQIMVSVLLKLREQSITGLPVHDAVIVPASDVETTHNIMMDTFKEIAKVEALVTEE